MAYASASNVAALCKNLLGSASTFSSSTCPTDTSVDTWLSSGCAVINAHISGNGYSVPVASTAAIYDELVDLNALYAATRAELSRINIVVNIDERARYQIFDKMFWDGLARLGSMDLTSMGLSKTSSTVAPYAGGISVADKESYETNTDRVNPRFHRGMHDFPGIRHPVADSDDYNSTLDI